MIIGGWKYFVAVLIFLILIALNVLTPICKALFRPRMRRTGEWRWSYEHREGTR